MEGKRRIKIPANENLYTTVKFRSIGIDCRSYPPFTWPQPHEGLVKVTLFSRE